MVLLWNSHGVWEDNMEFFICFFEKGVFGNGKEEARMKDRK
jgi:hypothetical protein